MNVYIVKSQESLIVNSFYYLVFFMQLTFLFYCIRALHLKAHHRYSVKQNFANESLISFIGYIKLCLFSLFPLLIPKKSLLEFVTIVIPFKFSSFSLLLCWLNLWFKWLNRTTLSTFLLANVCLQLLLVEGFVLFSAGRNIHPHQLEVLY